LAEGARWLQTLFASSDAIAKEAEEPGRTEELARRLRDPSLPKDLAWSLLWGLRNHLNEPTVAEALENVSWPNHEIAELFGFRHLSPASGSWQKKAFQYSAQDQCYPKWIASDAALFLARNPNPDQAMLAAIRKNIFNNDFTLEDRQKLLQSSYRFYDRPGFLDLILSNTPVQDWPRLVADIPKERLIAAVSSHPNSNSRAGLSVLAPEAVSCSRDRGSNSLWMKACGWALGLLGRQK
jgi:hypothetical protein